MGNPVSCCSSRSSPRINAPPPVMTMPRSTMSDASSGGVIPSARRTASTICWIGSCTASRISLECSRTIFGMPDTRSWPFTSISRSAPIGEEREMEVKGRDLVSGIPKIVRVHSSEIREAVQEPIQQIVDAVRRALEITPPELASDIVDRGIVMTGGGALIRGLDLLLQQETGLPIHLDEDPMTCVVRGAGRILDAPEKYRNVLTT